MGTARIVVLVIAAAAAALSVFLIRGLLSDNNTATATTTPQIVQMPTTKVLVANIDLHRGDRITEESLKWQHWPEEGLHKAFIKEKSNPEAIEDYLGAMVRITTKSGEPVTEEKVVESDNRGFMAVMITEGKRAVSTEISPETGAGGFILPDDRVDVISTRTQTTLTGEEFQSAETILENIRILAIDQTYEQSEDGERVVVGSTATLELSPKQAEKLAEAEVAGEITLSLRSLSDSSPQANSSEEEEGELASDSATVRIHRYGATYNVFVENAK